LLGCSTYQGPNKKVNQKHPWSIKVKKVNQKHPWSSLVLASGRGGSTAVVRNRRL
jgi:hypothetical protein